MQNFQKEKKIPVRHKLIVVLCAFQIVLIFMHNLTIVFEKY